MYRHSPTHVVGALRKVRYEAESSVYVLQCIGYGSSTLLLTAAVGNDR
jgi:hypothetical protein